MRDENFDSCKMQGSLPNYRSNSASSNNASSNISLNVKLEDFSTQTEELLRT